MAFYAYECEECKQKFTLQHGMNEKHGDCPICGASADGLHRIPTVSQVRPPTQQNVASNNAERSLEERRKNVKSHIESMREEMNRAREQR